MKWTIEYIETAKDMREAQSMLAWLISQDGYLGGRILPWTDAKPSWRVQVFFEDAPEAAWLPDGCNRRLTPLGLLAA